ncbi:hypothetical protein GCM10023333_24260 [Ferrimonas pelagia]|uniref:CN hydrolase domain-containing protein n=1 Tax=Ferrimonas pelagia TaxID=1177826 RepID=A0ABP9F5B7_9GAMM
MGGLSLPCYSLQFKEAFTASFLGSGSDWNFKSDAVLLGSDGRVMKRAHGAPIDRAMQEDICFVERGQGFAKLLDPKANGGRFFSD